MIFYSRLVPIPRVWHFLMQYHFRAWGSHGSQAVSSLLLYTQRFGPSPSIRSRRCKPQMATMSWYTLCLPTPGLEPVYCLQLRYYFRIKTCFLLVKFQHFQGRRFFSIFFQLLDLIKLIYQPQNEENQNQKCTKYKKTFFSICLLLLSRELSAKKKQKPTNQIYKPQSQIQKVPICIVGKNCVKSQQNTHT